MKLFTRALAFLALAFIFTLSAHAQSPEAINYQAVARNGSGQVLLNQSLGVRISIISGSAVGTLEYEETHSVSTNDFGLFTLQIGTGSVTSGVFGDIDWGDDDHYVKVEIDPAGGTNYEDLGTTQLVSVPYAFHATTVEFDEVDDDDADSTNELQMLMMQGDSITISDGNTIVIQDDVNDADFDPTNELQTLTYANDTLTISGGNSVVISSGGGAGLWTANSNDIFYQAGRVTVGQYVPVRDFNVVGDSAEIVVGYPNSFNNTNSGGIRFEENMTFSQTGGPCGFQQKYDGATNNFVITSGCPALDTTFLARRNSTATFYPNIGFGGQNPSANIDIRQTNATTAPGINGIRFNDPVGTSTPWQIWHATDGFSFGKGGTRVAYINNAGQYIQASDRRLKRNIAPLGSVLAGVMALEPVRYQYNYSEDVMDGFIAQDVEKVFPEIVTVNPETNMRGIDYNEFGILGIKAIQEQQEIIETQQSEIEELKAQLEELRKAVEALSAE